MSEFFKWEYVVTLFPKVLSALPTTLLIVLFATLIGSFLGFILAYFRIERIPVLHQLSAIYVSFIRGTPILVQMFIVFYGLPGVLAAIGLDISMWNKLFFLYITYGLNTAAYFSEIFRSALSSVPASQYEAAASIGLTKWQIYRRTLIPQAGKIALPNIGAGHRQLITEYLSRLYTGRDGHYRKGSNIRGIILPRIRRILYCCRHFYYVKSATRKSV
ncbi:amino acid ABC transporter permease [Bacillus pumilus]